MLKLLAILALGIVIGYHYGWSDAQVNDKMIAERLVDEIGGKTRETIARTSAEQTDALRK